MNCKKEKATVLFWNCIKNKIPTNKLNQWDERPIFWKLWNADEEVEDDRKKWKDIHGLEELTLLKCLFYCPQAIYRFKTSSSTYSGIFHRTRTNNPKTYMEPKKIPDKQSNREGKKKELSWKVTLPDFRLCYKTTVLRTPWCWQKQPQRSTEQNRVPRHKPTLLWSVNLWQKRQRHIVGKRSSLQ